MFHECVVCSTRTRERVTLVSTFENVPVCSERCQRIFLSYPWQFTLGGAETIEAEAPAAATGGDSDR